MPGYSLPTATSALGQAAQDSPPQPGWGRGVREPTPRERAGALAEWHHLLLDRLLDSGREDVLEALATHPALGGPELLFFQAKLAHRRGENHLGAPARRVRGQSLE